MVLPRSVTCNQSYEILKLKPADGVIGGDLLQAPYEAIIDYSKKTLVLKGRKSKSIFVFTSTPFNNHPFTITE
ncbi:MAG: hypothetical protein IPI23_10695 [Bacteroidetes bacterium]|nr:hypothetical protein [Bacteroidota bacterium]